MPVALLTDFGPATAYVGAMKGVVARLAPDARILDLAHDIPSQGVHQAGFVLAHSYRHFPEDTVFICVVDPGVGTERAVVAARAAGRAFVAPAGPLLADVLAREPELRAFEVTARDLFLDEVSSTFHGRDVFAPVGAHVAAGVHLERLGPERPPWELIERAPAPRPGHGRVRMVDRFGNLVTDAPPPAALADIAELEVGGHLVTVSARTYGEAPDDGTPFFYIGSYGTLEVAIRHGNASDTLCVGRGATVRTVAITHADAAGSEAPGPDPLRSNGCPAPTPSPGGEADPVNRKRLAHHHDFLPAGHTSRIGAVWVVELEAGEATDPRSHDELEEVYCMVEGEGEIVVAQNKRPLRAGEVIHVPALTRHWLRNPFPRRLRCLTVESVVDEAAAAESAGADTHEAEPDAPEAAEAPTAAGPQATEAPGDADPAALAESVGALEQVILDMPENMDRVAAIQKIVMLFDIAGQLSERIEEAYGLDNERGVNALTRIERRVMDAVVEVTRRYTFDDNDLDLGSFGGRLGKRT